MLITQMVFINTGDADDDAADGISYGEACPRRVGFLEQFPGSFLGRPF